MLDDLEDFASKFGNKPGAGKVFDKLGSTGASNQQGAQYAMRALKGEEASFVEQFEAKYADNTDAACDMVTSGGMKIDFKSWDLDKTINKIKEWPLSKQLQHYLGEPPFQMWFDYDKFKHLPNYAGVDEATIKVGKAKAARHIKEQYMELFTKSENLEHVMGSKYAQDFARSLANANNELLDEMVEAAIRNVDSDFYNFIKVQ